MPPIPYVLEGDIKELVVKKFIFNYFVLDLL